jgi:hypothetical protein
MRPVRCVHEDHQVKKAVAMKKQTCKCHPDNPFHWEHNPRPSIFLQDPAFRAKGVPATTDYRAFGIYSRAKPSVKPQLNKHEVPKGRL